jgi:hypothetical protein
MALPRLDRVDADAHFDRLRQCLGQHSPQQSRASRFNARQAARQLITHRYHFVRPDHDPLLFGERREWDANPPQSGQGDRLLSDSGRARAGLSKNESCLKHPRKKPHINVTRRTKDSNVSLHTEWPVVANHDRDTVRTN